MKRPALFFALLLALTASAAAFGISAAVDTPRTLMSRDDYAKAVHAIQMATRAAMADCRAVAVAQRDVCKARARGDERVQRAELHARYYGTVDADLEVNVARVKARFDVARAECGARSEDERSQCLRTAREERAREIRSKLASAT